MGQRTRASSEVIVDHNFDTTMLRGQEMLARLGFNRKEKVCRIELHNSKHMYYRNILITSLFNGMRLWRDYSVGPLG